MESIPMYATLMFGILFLFLALLFDKTNYKNNNEFYLYFILTIILFWVAGLLFGIEAGKDIGQKEALKGNQIYEMEIHYKEVDGEFIPTDTLFINIK